MALRAETRTVFKRWDAHLRPDGMTEWETGAWEAPVPPVMIEHDAYDEMSWEKVKRLFYEYSFTASVT